MLKNNTKKVNKIYFKYIIMTNGILYQRPCGAGFGGPGCGVPPPANCQQLAAATANGCVAFQKRNVSVCFNLCNDQWIIGWGYSATFNCQKKIVIFGTGENIDHCEKILHFDEIAVGSRLCVFLLTVKRKCFRGNRPEPYVTTAQEGHPRCNRKNGGGCGDESGYQFGGQSDNSYVENAVEKVNEEREGACVRYTCKEKYKIWKALICPPLSCSQAVEFLQVNEIKIDSIIECESNGHPIARYRDVRELIYPHLLLC